MVKEGVDSGTLLYDARPGSVSQSANVPFAVTPRMVSDTKRDFVINERQVIFRGSVVNAFDPASAVPITALVVTDAQRGELCRWAGTDQTTYSCYATVTSTDTLHLTYTVTGTWGTQQFSGITFADFPPVAGSKQVVRDLVVAPTTVHFTGIVRDPDGQPLENALMTVMSSSFAAEPQWCEGCDDLPAPQFMASTDADGIYHIYAPIRSDAMTGMVTYRAGYDDVEMDAGSLSLSGLQPNARNDRVRDVTFNRRAVELSGDIINLHAPATRVQADTITVLDAAGTVLCVESDVDNYRCRVAVVTMDAFVATVRVSGGWGETTVTVDVPADMIGSTNYVSQDVTVTPTTLKISGVGTFPDGQALSGKVTVSGADILGSATTGFDSAGQYQVFVPVRNVANGSVTVTTRYNADVNKTTTATFNATVGGLTALQHNITFDTRRVNLYGAVRNATHTSTPVLATEVVATAPGAGTLCTWSSAEGDNNFACDAELTTMSAFSVTLTIKGDWGTETLVGSVAAGTIGATTYARNDVAVHPTMVWLKGVISQQGGPKGSVQVRITGDGLARVRTQQVDTTNSSGEYNVYAIVREGMTSGSLTYLLTNGTANHSYTRSYSAPAAQAVNTVEHAITIP